MPSYQYRAKDGPSRVVTGTIDATSEDSAIEKIHELGFVPLSVKSGLPGGRAAVVASAPQVKGNLTPREALLFCQSLSSLLRSGVPILRALFLIKNQSRRAAFKDALQTVCKGVEDGKSLAQSMIDSGAVFPSLLVSIVAAGESGGSLVESLERMAQYLKKEILFRSKLIQALIYPVILVITGAGSLVFLFTFVIPRLAPLFANLGSELPLPTRMVLGLAQFASGPGFAVIAAIALSPLLFPRLVILLSGRSGWDLFKLRLPLWGALSLKTELARFMRTLQMSLQNGLPFVEGLEASISVLSNQGMADAFRAALAGVKEGERFAERISRIDWIPEATRHMIEVGEESGRLETVFGEIASNFEEETEDSLRVLMSLMEPVTILVLGGIIGWVVIAVLLPIFEMNMAI